MFLPLELTLRPSRVYAAVLAAAHGLALLGVWLAALAVWLKALMAVMLLGGAWQLWREHSGSPRALRVSQSGEVEALAGEWQAAGITGQPVVLPWLVSLKLEFDTGKKRRLILWHDSTDADLFRKLRVWLKWGRQL